MPYHDRPLLIFQVLELHSFSTSTGLAEVLITGGIPPMVSHENPCDEVYMATYQRVIAQNRKYYKRFPQVSLSLCN